MVTVSESVVPVPAPMWKVSPPALPARIALPLNLVPTSVRSISSASCWNSWSRLARSPLPLVALADCTASSRMRCSMSPTLASAPSATCAIEMPSLALRMATFMPRTWAFMRSAIASPAASSLELLTRRPVDSRWIDVAISDCEADRLRCAFSEGRFVLITWDIRFSFAGEPVATPCRRGPLQDVTLPEVSPARCAE